jgi:hypothetical protein
VTRDELERCAQFLRQGLDLPRETVRRLVDHALGATHTHIDGCAFFRGEECDCRDANGPLDLALKQALTGGARCVWECADCHIAQEGREGAFECIRCHSRAGTIDRSAKPGPEPR